MALSRRQFVNGCFSTAGVSLAGCGGGGSGGESSQPPLVRPNVLMICIDDLNDWVGCLGGHPQALTPNLDALASNGILFRDAHCNAPSCYPSRTSTLTGKMPYSLGVYHNNHSPFRDVYPDIKTLPQLFRDNGYTAFGSGKFFHAPDPSSWDSYWPSFKWQKPGEPFADVLPANGLENLGNIDWGAIDVPVEEFGDYRIANEWAPSALQASYNSPFFMAVGFYKPHLPWYLPPSYFNRFNPDATVLPQVLDTDRDDLGAIAKRWSDTGRHETIDAAGKWSNGVAAYLAMISYTDEMLGMLLGQLENSQHADNTIVVLWSDNGWHLGEKSFWTKNTLWHESTRVPMIVKMPNAQNAGQACDRPVSLVDLFPTLVDLCSLDHALSPDGISLKPLIENPGAPWARPAIISRGRYNNAIITDAWRYLQYSDGSSELYDRTSDAAEWHNLSGQAPYAATEEDLRSQVPDVQLEAI